MEEAIKSNHFPMAGHQPATALGTDDRGKAWMRPINMEAEVVHSWWITTSVAVEGTAAIDI